MNVNKLIWIGLFIFTGIFDLVSQEKSLKIYTNFLHLNSKPSPRTFDFEPAFINFDGISLAYAKRKRNWRNEFELGGKLLHLDREEYSGFLAYLRYQKGLYIPKKIFKKGQLVFGIGAKLYAFEELYRPLTNANVPVSFNKYGINIGPFAHFEYHLSENVFLDINSNLIALSFGLDRQYFDNPNLTENQKVTGGFDFDAWVERLLRIGIGYKFKPKEKE